METGFVVGAGCGRRYSLELAVLVLGWLSHGLTSLVHLRRLRPHLLVRTQMSRILRRDPSLCLPFASGMLRAWLACAGRVLPLGLRNVRCC